MGKGPGSVSWNESVSLIPSVHGVKLIVLLAHNDKSVSGRSRGQT